VAIKKQVTDGQYGGGPRIGLLIKGGGVNSITSKCSYQR